MKLPSIYDSTLDVHQKHTRICKNVCMCMSVYVCIYGHNLITTHAFDYKIVKIVSVDFMTTPDMFVYAHRYIHTYIHTYTYTLITTLTLDFKMVGNASDEYMKTPENAMLSTILPKKDRQTRSTSCV